MVRAVLVLLLLASCGAQTRSVGPFVELVPFGPGNHEIADYAAAVRAWAPLDTARHTIGGVMGGVTTKLAPVDYALACETIGICL